MSELNNGRPVAGLPPRERPVSVTISLAPSMIGRIDRLAGAHDWSRSALIRHVVEDYFLRADADEAS